MLAGHKGLATMQALLQSTDRGVKPYGNNIHARIIRRQCKLHNAKHYGNNINARIRRQCKFNGNNINARIRRQCKSHNAKHYGNNINARIRRQCKFNGHNINARIIRQCKFHNAKHYGNNINDRIRRQCKFKNRVAANLNSTSMSNSTTPNCRATTEAEASENELNARMMRQCNDGKTN